MTSWKPAAKKANLEDYKNDDGSSLQADVLAFIQDINRHGLMCAIVIAGDEMGDSLKVTGNMKVGTEHILFARLAEIFRNKENVRQELSLKGLEN